MSIALVVTRGFGNGTLTGTIADVVTRGFTIGAAIELQMPLTAVASELARTADPAKFVRSIDVTDLIRTIHDLE